MKRSRASLPADWPADYVYSTSCRMSEIHPALLEQFISTGHPEDAHAVYPLIEKGGVHPHLELKKITAQVKGADGRPHPLSRARYGKRVHRGLFAKRGLPDGVELGEYVGELQLLAADWKRGLKDFDHAWTLKSGPFLFVLNAKKFANELAFINDYRGIGRSANAKPKWVVHKGLFHLIVVTTCPIRPGEEVLIDYGVGYWEAASRKQLLPPSFCEIEDQK